MVRRVDHQGLLGQAQVIQDPEDAPDGIVDPFDTGTIGGQGAQGDRLVPVVALRTALIATALRTNGTASWSR